MAQMIPSMEIPPGARGEAKFYLALEEGLPDDFLIFHNLEYVTVFNDGGLLPGEVDFLIVHQRLGLLEVEVKGGDLITYSPREDCWRSVGMHGQESEITDPFKQARRNLFEMVERIRNRIYGGNRNLPFTYGYAVAFPDAKVSCENYPPECPAELVINASDLARIRDVVENLFKGWARNTRKPGFSQRQFSDSLNKVLIPEFRLAGSVGLDIQTEANVLQRLTDDQYDILDMLGEHKRAVIKGYAGTGKTFVAFEKARRLAVDGSEVLLLCYNRQLAKHLRETAKRAGPWSKVCTVQSFHGLCRYVTELAGLPFEPPEEDEDPEVLASFWEEQAPLALLEAAGRMNVRFDAIVIDEAQDFSPNWFDVVEQLLADTNTGCLYIFYDPAQNIFGKEIILPIEDTPHTLDRNCRNTKRIAEYVGGIAGVTYRFPYGSVEGRPVEGLAYSNRLRQPALIEKLLKQLLSQDVEPQQVAVLSPYRQENSCLAGKDEIAGLRLTSDVLCGDDGMLRFSTLKSFKGLEADVVIVCDINPSSCDAIDQYVSMSRAKHRLFLLHSKDWEPSVGSP